MQNWKDMNKEELLEVISENISNIFEKYQDANRIKSNPTQRRNGMKELIQTQKCSIVYGEFQGKENQELFRCPRELDSVDLKNYINRERCMLGFESESDTSDLKASNNYLGYYRLYFSGRWYGRWFDHEDQIKKLDEIVCHGVDEIVDWLGERFPKGCNWEMEDYLKKFPNCGCEHRYLLKPLMSEHYKVMFDTTYGNGDYPVRIYVYE